MALVEPAEIEPAERESDCLLTAGSSSIGAREADEQIEKRTGPTSKRLQWGRCNRSRPMASEHVEGTKPPMSTADLPQSRARVAIMLVEQSGKVYPATTNIRKPASEPGPQRSKRHRGGVFNPPVPGQEKSAGLRDRVRGRGAIRQEGRTGQGFLLGEHLWLVLHHSQASSILVFDLLQGDERAKMAIRPHYKAPAADD